MKIKKVEELPELGKQILAYSFSQHTVRSRCIHWGTYPKFVGRVKATAFLLLKKDKVKQNKQ